VKRAKAAKQETKRWVISLEVRSVYADAGKQVRNNQDELYVEYTVIEPETRQHQTFRPHESTHLPKRPRRSNVTNAQTARSIPNIRLSKPRVSSGSHSRRIRYQGA